MEPAANDRGATAIVLDVGASMGREPRLFHHAVRVVETYLRELVITEPQHRVCVVLTGDNESNTGMDYKGVFLLYELEVEQLSSSTVRSMLGGQTARIGDVVHSSRAKLPGSALTFPCRAAGPLRFKIVSAGEDADDTAGEDDDTEVLQGIRTQYPAIQFEVFGKGASLLQLSSALNAPVSSLEPQILGEPIAPEHRTRGEPPAMELSLKPASGTPETVPDAQLQAAMQLSLGGQPSRAAGTLIQHDPNRQKALQLSPHKRKQQQRATGSSSKARTVQLQCPTCRADMGELRRAFMQVECVVCMEDVAVIMVGECGHIICPGCAGGGVCAKPVELRLGVRHSSGQMRLTVNSTITIKELLRKIEAQLGSSCQLRFMPAQGVKLDDEACSLQAAGLGTGHMLTVVAVGAPLPMTSPVRGDSGGAAVQSYGSGASQYQGQVPPPHSSNNNSRDQDLACLGTSASVPKKQSNSQRTQMSPAPSGALVSVDAQPPGAAAACKPAMIASLQSGSNGSWACGTCTFQHIDSKASFLTCELCGAERSQPSESSKPCTSNAPVTHTTAGPQKVARVPVDGWICFEPHKVAPEVCAVCVFPRCVCMVVNPLTQCAWCPWQETLEEFMAAVSPATLRSPETVGWIAVSNPMQLKNQKQRGQLDLASYQPYLDKITNVLEDQKRNAPHKRAVVTRQLKDDVVGSILQTATSQGYTVGKVMLFPTTERVEETWRVVATKTVAGQLGCSAKVSPNPGRGDTHLICVYTRDFSQLDEIKAVYQRLEGCLDMKLAGYKPDIFTALEINSANRWRLEPTIYSPRQLQAEVTQPDSPDSLADLE